MALYNLVKAEASDSYCDDHFVVFHTDTGEHHSNHHCVNNTDPCGNRIGGFLGLITDSVGPVSMAYKI
jgi:hypothetical protein